jgi:hypothetical protein
MTLAGRIQVKGRLLYNTIFMDNACRMRISFGPIFQGYSLDPHQLLYSRTLRQASCATLRLAFRDDLPLVKTRYDESHLSAPGLAVLRYSVVPLPRARRP